MVKARGGLSQGYGKLRLRLSQRYSSWDAGTAAVKAGTGGTGHGCCRTAGSGLRWVSGHGCGRTAGSRHGWEGNVKW